MMQKFTKDRSTKDRTKDRTLCCGANRERLLLCGQRVVGRYANGLLAWLVVTTIMTIVLSGCGGGGASSGGSQQSAALSGNWQFTLFQNPDPNYPPGQQYGLQGGFLLQANGSITGQAVYSVSNLDQSGSAQVCNAGSATVTAGTFSSNTVNLTYVAGSQTFTLTGMLSNGTMSGTYTATQGTAPDGTTVCGIGTSQSGPQQWTAISVPPLAGTITGSFHSAAIGNGLLDQDFPVTGTLTQGENIGASNATVTGTLNFTGYPCIPGGIMGVNGQITGNTAILQLIGTNGSNDGQIGVAASQAGIDGNGSVVQFNSTPNGYVLQSTGIGTAYVVNTKTCPSNSSVDDEDVGYICLAVNSTTACQEPITLSPAAVTFPAQMLTTPATAQTITLANNSSAPLIGLTLAFSDEQDFGPFDGYSDFNGVPSLKGQDSCVPGGETLPPSGTPGSKFDLNSGQTCSITVTFSPQESCSWLPFPASGSPQSIAGAAPEYCPFPQGATVAVNSPASADQETSFVVPVTGIGLSAVQPSTPELDFGAENQLNPPEASLPQTLSLTNYSANPVQILGSAPCMNPAKAPLKLPRPLTYSSEVAGLLVVGSPPGVNNPITPDLGTNPVTITYNCDSDPGTLQPNFPISIASDTCTGTLLAPQASCSLQVAYVPQPNTDVNSGMNYFLELNTVQCTNAPNEPLSPPGCEIDSGRFPVELRANTPSPLRMSPSAGLDFGYLKKGSTSAPLTITLLNDPNLTYPQCTAQNCAPVTFAGKILSSNANYSESDDCPATLAQGSSCTLIVTFTPSSTGFTAGNLTINYTQISNSGTVTTGNPQFVYLRGTGQ